VNALVLAAGNGDRFLNGSRRSKLLQPVAGQPLILRTIHTAADAGVTAFEIVLGYDADVLRRAIEEGAPRHTAVHFTFNPEWHLENGVSALAARERLSRERFALLMGDHLFESPVLARLLRTPIDAGASILAVDSRPVPRAIADEATKVRLDGNRITAIGKDLDTFDALDTGLFVCTPALFSALEHARAGGDTTLSGGIRHLAAQGLMRAADIGNAAWYDIDTVADLEAAETQLDALPETA
jgi:choline kinase